MQKPWEGSRINAPSWPSDMCARPPVAARSSAGPHVRQAAKTRAKEPATRRMSGCAPAMQQNRDVVDGPGLSDVEVAFEPWSPTSTPWLPRRHNLRRGRAEPPFR
jgi:hypothetical protein